MEFNKNAIPIAELPMKMEAFNVKHEPIPFDIIVSTCNYSKNTGGQILMFENVIQAKFIRLMPKFINFSVSKSVVDTVRPELKNRIRRLFFLDSKEVRNVNIRYITHFKFHHEPTFTRIAY